MYTLNGTMGRKAQVSFHCACIYLSCEIVQFLFALVHAIEGIVRLSDPDEDAIRCELIGIFLKLPEHLFHRKFARHRSFSVVVVVVVVVVL